MNALDKLRTMSTKKLVIGGISVIVVVSLGCMMYEQSQVKQVEASQMQLDNQTQEIGKLVNELTALLDKKDANYLKVDVEKEQIDELSEQLKQLEEASIDRNLTKVEYGGFESVIAIAKETLEQVETAYATQTTVNALYKKEKETLAMNGSKVNSELPIVDDLKTETVTEAMQNVMKKDKMFTEETAEYDKVVSDLILGADKQLTQIETAKTDVGKVYKENKVISTDKSLYDKAKAETDKIKNEKAKKELSDKLAKVKADIETKEKEEAEKKASEEANAPEESVGAPNQGATVNDPTYVGNDYSGNHYSANEYTGGGSNYTDNAGSPSNGGGQASTPPNKVPDGYVGPFSSESEADLYGVNNAVTGYALMEIDGLWYVTVF